MIGGQGVVYFEKGIPSIYHGEMAGERDLLKWVKKQVEGDDIEDVNKKMMDKIIRGQVGDRKVFGEHADAAVLFYKNGDPSSSKVLKALENIDDDCEEQGIIFVKTGDEALAVKLGITVMPTLVYYESNVPHLYAGDLRVERDVLDWLIEQLTNDEIEEVVEEVEELLNSILRSQMKCWMI